jgi:hypothetical protein
LQLGQLISYIDQALSWTAENSGLDSRWEQEIVFFSVTSTPALGHIQISYAMGIVGGVPGGKTAVA